MIPKKGSLSTVTGHAIAIFLSPPKLTFSPSRPHLRHQHLAGITKLSRTSQSPSPISARMSTETTDPIHHEFILQALDQANSSEPVPSAFCVGAVLVSSESEVLATGYSRELPGNTHAEACAIDKYLAQPDADESKLRGAAIYTTMEPCSVRLSGNIPCVERILQAGISKVYLGVEEPIDFVVCEGTRMLTEKGVEVFVVRGEGLQEKCLIAARRLSQETTLAC